MTDARDSVNIPKGGKLNSRNFPLTSITILLLMIGMVSFSLPAESKTLFAQNDFSLLGETPSLQKESVAKSNETAGDPECNSDESSRRLARYFVLVTVPLLTYTVAFSSWGWADRTSWLWANEGWFGHSTYEGGFDKVCHVWSHYMVFRASYNCFDYSECGRPRKWIYAATVTGLLGLCIEFGDAFSGQNGFSYEDIITDLTGIGIGALLEKFPIADKFVSLSIEYSPTKYFRQRPGLMIKFPDDYSGWTVMANLKLAGFREIGLDVPDFLRYVMVDIGYYARGYTKYDRRAAWEGYRYPTKSQNVFIGFSVNMMEVVKDFFENKNSLACRAAQQPFKYYHVPAGVKFSQTIDESVGHPKVGKRRL